MPLSPLVVVEPHELEQAHLRDGVALAAGGDEQRRDDRERQRDLHLERGAAADDGLHVDRAADRSMFVFTTSMPTPRPEMLLTCSAVEKPGWKMTLTISRSGREAASSAVMIPFCTALRRIALASIPAPSSEISMIT
jgi:hypothetical protein